MNTLAEFFTYNDWAQERLNAAAAQCSDEALDTPFDMGEGSLRKTLVHLWGAEECWLQRWRGVPVTVEDEEALSVEEVGHRFLSTAAARTEWFQQQDAASLEQSFRYQRPSWMDPGPEMELHTGVSLLHVLNHGVHHRTQAVNMLHRLGVAPPVLDYIRMGSPTAVFDMTTLGRYLRHGEWAFRQVHEAAAGLPPEALDRVFPLGPGTLRKIMRHLADAPGWWMDNIDEGPGKPFPSIVATDTWDELWIQYAAAARRLHRHIQDADLDHPVTVAFAPGRQHSFRLGVVLMQLCTHGTHHRAQALNMLRHSGVQVPSLDVAVWQRAGAPSVL